MFPLSVGIAVLRFRLYDLDVVVRKTLIYGAFALFATLIYLGLVVGARQRGWASDNSFLTMVAAVVVAVTFQPARARLTRFANRVVYGKRATPYEVLSEFSERVGGGIRRRGRAAADGADPGRGDRRRPGRRLARGRPGAARRRGLARRRRPSGADRAAERLGPHDPGRRSRVPGRVGGRAAGRARDPQAGERSGDAVGREADRRPRRAGGTRAPQRPPERRAEGAVRRAEGGAEAPGLRAGRGAPAARAQHPRRRAAAARRARGQAQARRQPDRTRHREGARAPRADPARDARGARGSARSGPRHLPAAARRQGPAPRRSRRRPQERSAGRGPRGRRRSLSAGRRGGRVLLVPRGAAERGEVRRGVARSSSTAGRSAATHLGSPWRDDGRGFDPTASRIRHGAAGDRGPAGRARRVAPGDERPGSGRAVGRPAADGARVDGHGVPAAATVPAGQGSVAGGVCPQLRLRAVARDGRGC